MQQTLDVQTIRMSLGLGGTIAGRIVTAGYHKLRVLHPGDLVRQHEQVR